MAEPKFQLGQVVSVCLCSWEAEDLVIHGPIINCLPRQDVKQHPEDQFLYEVQGSPFKIRESLLSPCDKEIHPVH